MEQKLKRALQQSVSFLHRNGIKYAVIGGIANQYWGRARFTFDVDIKVQVPETDYDTVRGKIRSRFPNRARPHTPENPLIVDVMIADVAVDFLLAIPGYDENIIARAISCEIEKSFFWMCASEDLIIQKAIAGRPRDWEDIEGILIEQQDKLDYTYIHGWLEQFVDALESPETMEKYREIRDKISRLA